MTVRLRAAVALLVVVAIGLGLQLFRSQIWTDPAGTIFYVAAIACLGAVIIVRRPLLVTVLATVLALVVEAWQATGMPAELVRVVPPLRVVLGTTFTCWDVLWTLVAAPMVWGVMRLVSPSVPATL